MLLSATDLGKTYGLTSEEMNRVLVKRGILIGDSGDYDVTPLGRRYVHTESHHRGIGGYSMYNRAWTTRKFDESIKDVLDITSELKDEVRPEIAYARAARCAAMKAAREKANADFIAKQAAKKATELAEKEKERREIANIIRLKKIGRIGLILVGTTLVTYGTYKLIKYIKQTEETLEEE